MLGSPIPPVVRGEVVQPELTPKPNPTPPAGTATHGPTTYRYVSGAPAAPPQRPPLDTPPYYQMPPEAPPPDPAPARPYRTRPPSTPFPPPEAFKPPTQPARVRKYPVPVSWSPDSRLDFRRQRALSDQVFPLAVESCFVLGVTSVREARGQKGRVAAELALALAEPRHPRVLLLDADFQWPVVHDLMRIEMPMSQGYSQQLRARSHGPTEDWAVVACSPSLHVLGEGIMRSPGLILSIQFEESIRSLRTYYDLIVIHGPDAVPSAEIQAFASTIDGLALVVPEAGSPGMVQALEFFPDLRFSVTVGV
jgi:Mrp family chromosome partitioning ATPase